MQFDLFCQRANKGCKFKFALIAAFVQACVCVQGKATERTWEQVLQPALIADK